MFFVLLLCTIRVITFHFQVLLGLYFQNKTTNDHICDIFPTLTFFLVLVLGTVTETKKENKKTIVTYVITKHTLFESLK